MYHFLQHTETLHSAKTDYFCVPHDFHDKQRFFFINNINMSRGDVVGIVIGYGLNYRGVGVREQFGN
jgi:hypothetical protein